MATSLDAKNNMPRSHLLVKQRPEDRNRNVDVEDVEQGLDVSDQFLAEAVVGVVQPVLPVLLGAHLLAHSVLERERCSRHGSTHTLVTESETLGLSNHQLPSAPPAAASNVG